MFVEETLLSLLNGFNTVVENQLTIDVWVNFQILNSVCVCVCVCVCVSTLVPLPRCLNYRCFAIHFEIRKCELSNFVLFKIIFTTWGSYNSIQIRVFFFSESTKSLMEFL